MKRKVQPAQRHRESPVGGRGRGGHAGKWSWSRAPSVILRKAAMGAPITAPEYRGASPSVLAEVRRREGRINSGGNTKHFALVLENPFQGGEFFHSFFDYFYFDCLMFERKCYCNVN